MITHQNFINAKTHCSTTPLSVFSNYVCLMVSDFPIVYPYIPGVPEKGKWQIFSTLQAKSVMYFTSLDKASSPEENNTKIIKFG